MRLLQIKLTGTKEDIIKSTKMIESTFTVEAIERMSGIISNPNEGIFYRFVDVDITRMKINVTASTTLMEQKSLVNSVDKYCTEPSKPMIQSKKWWLHFSFRQ